MRGSTTSRRKGKEALLAATAAAQCGAFNLAQALACGHTRRSVDYGQVSGAFERLLQGVYRIGGAPSSWEQNVWAAVLWAQAPDRVREITAAAWGPTAAALHGFEGFTRTPVEVATCGHKRGSDLMLPDGTPIQIHRVDHYRFNDLELGQARVPCTSIRHTILDLLGRRHPRGVRTLDDGLFRDASLFGQLALLYEVEWTRGRRGIAILRDLLLERHPGAAPTQTELEDLFRGIVKDFGLPVPTNQYPVELEGGTHRVDFAYTSLKIAIECDSYAWHGHRSAFEKDRKLDVDLQDAGWTVLRFTWATLRYERAYVANKVRRFFELRSPHPPTGN